MQTAVPPLRKFIEMLKQILCSQWKGREWKGFFRKGIGMGTEWEWKGNGRG